MSRGRFQPQLIVDTTLASAAKRSAIVVNNHETVTCSLKMAAGARRKAGIPLESLTVPAGKTATFFVLYSGGGQSWPAPTTLEEAVAARERAVAYWQQAPLPYGRVQVPDAGIQALIDSSIRNIWQAREIKKPNPSGRPLAVPGMLNNVQWRVSAVVLFMAFSTS